MSPDFIPSQPEGVYLYPFLQAPWSALGAPPTSDGAAGFSIFPSIILYLTSDTANTGNPRR